MNKNIETIKSHLSDLKKGKRGFIEIELTELEKDLDDYRRKEEVVLKDFFMWFRENGEKHLGRSIEQLITIYLNEK